MIFKKVVKNQLLTEGNLPYSVIYCLLLDVAFFLSIFFFLFARSFRICIIYILTKCTYFNYALEHCFIGFSLCCLLVLFVGCLVAWLLVCSNSSVSSCRRCCCRSSRVAFALASRCPTWSVDGALIAASTGRRGWWWRLMRWWL